jgi:hypothetical protein
VAIVWRSFYTLAHGKEGRGATTIPVPLSAEWVRVEIIPLTFPRPKWYRGGWINPVVGKDLLPSRVCTLVEPSIHHIALGHPYQIRFKPVAYLPRALVRFYRSVDPPVPDSPPETLDGGEY